MRAENSLFSAQAHSTPDIKKGTKEYTVSVAAKNSPIHHVYTAKFFINCVGCFKYKKLILAINALYFP